MKNLQLVELIIAGLGLLYTLYLFSRSSERVGRVVTLSAWSVAAILIWFLNLPFTLYLLLHIGLIWLILSLYFYTSPLSALADLGLSGLSMAAAVLGSHTHREHPVEYLVLLSSTSSVYRYTRRSEKTQPIKRHKSSPGRSLSTG